MQISLHSSEQIQIPYPTINMHLGEGKGGLNHPGLVFIQHIFRDTHRNQKLFFLLLFTELFRKDISPHVRISAELM